MNNIYKVIWSKAKNCYVVASEIARSHTKSASGSEKIGGGTRRKLLASLMALSLLCGGLGVAEAAVHVDETGGANEVYTTTEVNAALDKKADKTALETKADATNVATNTANIATNTTNIATNTANIATNTTNIATNTANIATNTTNIATNTANIATNTTNIATNTANIATNTTNIATNTANIATNTANIATNTANIATNTTNIATNAANIATNKADITALQNELGNKADESTVTTALGTKADTATVTALDGRVGDLETAVGDASHGLVKEVNDLKTQGTALNTALGDKADKSDLLAATNRIAANEGEITALKNKTGQLSADGKELKNMTTVSGATVSGDNVKAGELTVTGKIKDGAGVTTTLADIKASMTQTATNKDDITTLKMKTDGQQTAIDGLNAKTINITHDATGTSVDGVTFNAGKVTGVTSINGIDIGDAQVDMKGKDLTGVGTINGTKIGNQEGGEYISQDGSIWGNLKTVDGQMKKNADNIETNKNAIATLDTKVGKIDDRTGGITRNTEDTQTTIEKKVTVNNSGDVGGVKGLSAETITTGALTVTGASDLKGNVTLGTNEANTVTVNGESHFKAAVNMDNGLTVDKGLTVTNGDTTLQKTDVKGALNVTGESSLKNTKVDGTLTAEKDATFEKDVTVKGTTNLKDTTVTGDLTVTGTITTDKMIFGEKTTNNYTEIDHGKVTSKNQVVTGTGEIISSSSTFDVEKNEVGFGNGITGDQSYHKQTSDGIIDNVNDQHNSNNRTQTKTETKDIITDENGNSSTTSQTASKNETSLKDKDGKNTNTTIDTANGYDKTIKGENGKTSTKQEAGSISSTVYDKDGKVKASSEMKEDGSISNNATGDMTNTVGGKLETTVTGQATQNFNGGLDTNVTGTENHTVTGNQNIHVTKNQTNKIDGDQVNIIGGSQTTTATDINRNASSGMIDTVKNASGSNTETKVAGQTTTDVKLASGEEGLYIRGATESRDYLLNGTLKNSETKTVEATTSEITDGTNKASTRQDAKNLAGSVTNGNETGVSGIHANADGSVSIDSAVAGGGMSSVINQKKDSITSAVGDGTNSTVILQDKDNVTIASSNGTVAIGGKDIVNNAQDTITNTAGTKITDKAGDSTVTTENGKGTTFAKTGSTAYSTKAGAPTDTNIAGNHISTGRVDANELGVSDKDGANSADLSVKAGEDGGVKASASKGTTKGSLDVTAEEVGSTVTDGIGKSSTFKQRIDKIMGNVKTDAGESEVTQEGDNITSVVGKGEATNSRVTQKKGSLEAAVTDGTNTNVSYDTADESAKELKGGTKVNRLYDNLNGSQKTIADGANTNLSIDTASASVRSLTAGTKENKQQDNLDSSEKIITNGTYKTSTMQSALDITHTAKDGTITHDAKDIVNEASKSITNKVGDNTSETMKNGEITTFIKDGDKENTVTSTADGTTFNNSKANTVFEGGTYTDTTIKGNTITTGKVTMDYAEVMKDLGVHGNATVDKDMTVKGNTTLGEAGKDTTLTVNSKATFNEKATFEQGAEVKNGLTVSSGGLNVTGESTFNDKVTMNNGLDVTGGVASDSFTVKGTDIKIDSSGINAGGTVISNVADGSISEGSKDAVNGGQLYGVKRDLEHQVDKVGANAAAMANLRPMEFDPSSKWNIAAAIGNYGSETAAALGAFYRPNDDVMVNFSTAFGTGENMVGGGVSVRLGKGSNKLSREESNALKDQVNDLTARMDALLSVLNPNMSKDFPDVPENHWAYEAVSRLAGNDIVQGYPDGEFHGDRTMTRYEMAEIIYNALSRGAEAERELVEEFKPELQAMAASEKATAERAEG